MTSPQASAIRTADAPVLIEAVENLSQIRIVMVNTTLAANIGAAARALKTMGLTRLILVAPKHFPSPEATALAAGAVDLLNHVEVVDSLEAAIAAYRQGILVAEQKGDVQSAKEMGVFVKRLLKQSPQTASGETSA